MKRKGLVRKIYWVSGFLILFVLIYLSSVFFLNPSSVGSPNFGRNINIWAVIWTISFLLVFVLAYVLSRDIVKLLFEFQSNKPGSRIKAKLVGALVVISLFPVVVMSILALGLINETLDRWFRSPSKQLLLSSRRIEQDFYALHREAALRQAADLANRLGGDPQRPVRVVPPEGAGDFRGVLIFASDGQLVDEQGNWATPQTRPAALQAVRAALPDILAGTGYYVRRKSGPDDIGLGGSTTYDIGFAGAPIRDARGTVRGAVVARFVMPESVEFYQTQVEEAFAAFDDILKDEPSLRIAYFTILGLSALAVIFGFVWLGTYIARRLTSPIEALARGSRELAEGNLAYRVEVEAVDDLRVLVDSFNRMAEEIRHSRRRLEEANAELRSSNVQLDDRRRYIETILHNIATGVLSLDREDVVQSVNEAAQKIFGHERDAILGKRLEEFADPEFCREYSRLRRRADLFRDARRELSLKAGDRQMQIAATVTAGTSPAAAEPQYLLVLDDVTELLRAEKFAAWQEVARRLAHEIKNPLTPIQLSAERVRRRFERIVASRPVSEEWDEFGSVLSDAMDIIAQEAKILKSLVLEFAGFARLPACRLRSAALHPLIDRTLLLYDGQLSEVDVERDFDERIDEVRIDPDQLQRVFVNLIDNSLDALAESDGKKRLVIRTAVNPSGNALRVEFADNGVGIRPEDYETLFLPYFSTKKKGTGLGLAIVRQIVGEHNGSIRAEPNPPRGTTFIMEFPLHE